MGKKRFDDGYVVQSDNTKVDKGVIDERTPYRELNERHRRFLEGKQSSEVFYDPFTKRRVVRGIPLKLSSPEFDIIGLGRNIFMSAVKPGIALTKRADYRLPMNPRNYEYMRNIGKVAKFETARELVENAIRDTIISDR